MVKPSSVHRETVASTKRENPGLLESSSGGSGNSSSNPLSKHPTMKSIDIKRNSSRGQNMGLQFLHDRPAENIPLIVSFFWVRMIRHRESKRKVYTIFWQEDSCEVSTKWDESHFQYWEEDWRRTHVWGLTALRPPQKIQNKICHLKRKSEFIDIRAIRRHSAEVIVLSRRTNYLSPQRAVTHTEECVTQRKSDIQKGSTHTLFI